MPSSLVKGERKMKREEILKKTQQEKSDERAEQVKGLSFRWTYLTMAAAAAIFAYFRAAQGQSMMDLCATVCFSVCAGMVYRFVKTREKSCILLAAVTFAVTFVAAVQFLMGR